MAKKPKTLKARHRFQIPTPPGISTPRFFIGKLFGSMEYWPRIIVALALLYGVIRARVSDLPKIVEYLTKALEASSILGWAVAACVLLFSLITIAFLLWWYHREFDRVARQRDKLQEELMQQKVQRST